MLAAALAEAASGRCHTPTDTAVLPRGCRSLVNCPKDLAHYGNGANGLEWGRTIRLLMG